MRSRSHHRIAMTDQGAVRLSRRVSLNEAPGQNPRVCICELKVKTRFSAQLSLTERTNSESRSEFWGEKREQMKDCFHLG